MIKNDQKWAKMAILKAFLAAKVVKLLVLMQKTSLNGAIAGYICYSPPHTQITASNSP